MPSAHAELVSEKSRGRARSELRQVVDGQTLDRMESGRSASTSKSAGKRNADRRKEVAGDGDALAFADLTAEGADLWAPLSPLTCNGTAQAQESTPPCYQTRRETLYCVPAFTCCLHCLKRFRFDYIVE